MHPPPGPYGQEGQGGQPTYPQQGYPQQPSYPRQPQGWGDPPGHWDYGSYGGYGGYGGYGEYGAYGAYQQTKRPGTVLGGAIVTYVGSGAMVLFGLLLLLGSASGTFIESFASSAGLAGQSSQELRSVLLIGGVVTLVYGAVVIALTVVAQMGRQWGRILLTVVGAIYIVLSLVLVFTGGYASIIAVVWVGVALMLFWIGGANDWYRAKQRQ